MPAKLKKIPHVLKKHLKIVIPLLLAAILVGAVVIRANQTTTSYVTEEAQVRNVATYLTLTGNIEAVSDAALIPKVAETVTAVHVSIGDEVKKGDVLATLNDSTIQKSIAKQEANLTTTQLNNYYAVRDAQKTYDDYVTGINEGHNSQLMSAQTSLNNAKTAYETAKETYERDKMELENNIDSSMMSSNNQIASAQLALNNAKNNYDENEANIRGMEKGVENAQDAYDNEPSASNESALKSAENNLKSAEDKRTSLQASIDSAQLSYDNAVNSYLTTYYNANVSLETEYKEMNNKYDAYVAAQNSYDAAVATVNSTLQSYANSLEKTTSTSTSTSAELELDDLYDQLDDYKIIATIDGTITSLDINEGDSVTKDTAVVEITDYSKMKVAVQIDEDNISQVTAGMEMNIAVDALGTSYTGTLENISRKATISGGLSYFTADVIFEADENIYSGLSAEVTHLLRGVENVVSVSMSALKYNDDNTAYVLIGSNPSAAASAEKRSVTVGMSNGTYVEITEGLSEGESVLVEQSATSATMMNMTMGMGGGMQGDPAAGMGGGAPAGGGAHSGGGARPGN